MQHPDCEIVFNEFAVLAILGVAKPAVLQSVNTAFSVGLTADKWLYG